VLLHDEKGCEADGPEWNSTYSAGIDSTSHPSAIPRMHIPENLFNVFEDYTNFFFYFKY